MSTKLIEAPAAAATVPPDPMLPRPYRVQRLREETRDTFTVELEPVSVNKGFPFLPGQFNMLYAFGVGEVPISISGDPSKPATLVHTTREVGAVTRALRKLKPSDMLGVRGPFGTGWPISEYRGSDLVFVAGGIGLAPLRPALYQVLSARKYYGRVVLLYGTRTPTDILFKRELQHWHSRFDLEVHVTVDRAMGNWRGNVGVVTSLIPRAPFDPHSTVAMVCGPEVMMRFTVQELERRGVGLDSIYVSMERNMKCAIGLCGHCQFGSAFVCKHGPVFRYNQVEPLFAVREI
jgi:NAD(P)H-flavin reductase